MVSKQNSWLNLKPGEKVCHGCGGKGWVPIDGRPHICPVCRGKGKLRDYPEPQVEITWQGKSIA